MTTTEHGADQTPGSRAAAHPIAAAAGAVAAALDAVVSTPGWSMAPDEQRTTLVELARVEARLVGLRLRVLAAADVNDIGDESGASSTPAWVAHAARQTRQAAHADLHLAAALDQDHEATRAALATGRVNVEQARVIVTALDRLTEDVAVERKQAAEVWLVAEAARHDAKTLAVLGRRLFEVIDPDAADQEEGRILDEQERRARAVAAFSIHANGDGTSSGRFKVPDLHADMLAKAIAALVAPRRTGQARVDPETGKKTPYPTLLGQGFIELIEHLPTQTLPTAGGIPATVVVTISLESLLSGIGAATLDTGTRISAGEARRLACAAGIIPMVLDGDSMPLDVGRERRLHTKYQRIGLAHRDRGCNTEGCDRPPAWTEAHHTTPWATGGHTSTEDGELLCPHHHRLVHHTAYHHTRLPTGQLRFHRRQ